MRRGIERIYSGEETDCVIVTHSVLCKLMILYALNIPNSHFWDITFDPASISLMKKRDSEMTIHFVNDTCHLRLGTESGTYRDF